MRFAITKEEPFTAPLLYYIETFQFFIVIISNIFQNISNTFALSISIKLINLDVIRNPFISSKFPQNMLF
jgi:hypothetical protein